MITKWVIVSIVMIVVAIVWFVLVWSFLPLDQPYRSAEAWNIMHFFFWMILAWSGMPWYWALAAGVGWEVSEFISDFISRAAGGDDFWYEQWSQKGLNLIADTLGYMLGFILAAIPS